MFPGFAMVPVYVRQNPCGARGLSKNRLSLLRLSQRFASGQVLVAAVEVETARAAEAARRGISIYGGKEGRQ